MRLLVTGTAGFIGFHLTRRLLAEGHEVTGFDGITPYYDVTLKQRRHQMLAESPNFTARIGMLEDKAALWAAFESARPEVVVHLAAQAGVRHSIEQPQSYIDANLTGTFNVLEAARAMTPRHLLIASSSSVYGVAAGVSRETDTTDRPLSLYAATKKATEAMSHSYAHLFGIPTTNLRFFTVYGPWGRPDMALFKFVAAIEKGEPIEVYGEGRMRRDFTYVADNVEAVARLTTLAPEMGKPVSAEDTLSPVAPWRVINIAGGQPVPLMRFIAAIEASMGQVADKIMLPMQPGDVTQTAADASLLRTLVGKVPETPVETGVAAFVEWYRQWRAIR